MPKRNLRTLAAILTAAAMLTSSSALSVSAAQVEEPSGAAEVLQTTDGVRIRDTTHPAATSSGAYDRFYETDDGFLYYIKYDGTIEIALFKNISKTAVIPSEIEGRTVTSISDKAFLNSWITEVTIPDTVTYIGDYAFSGAADLTTVKLPGSVKKIGEGTFMNCTSLEELPLQDEIYSIGKNAFSGCTALKEIILPDSVEELQQDAFSGCTAVEKIKLPASLQRFSESVTYNKYSMYPQYEDEFYFNVEDFNNIYSIFAVDNLKEVVTPDGFNPDLCSGFAYLYDAAYPDADGDYRITPDGVLIKYCGSSPIVDDIPDNVRYIAAEAFEGNKGILTVEIPDFVVAIGESAFKDSTVIDVTIPSSVSYIGQDAFAATPYLNDNKDEFMIVGDGILIKHTYPENFDGNLVIPAGVKGIRQPIPNRRSLPPKTPSATSTATVR